MSQRPTAVVMNGLALLIGTVTAISALHSERRDALIGYL